MSKLISFMLGALFLVSCGEHTELEQPIVNNDGETVAVTKEIQVRVLPMQSVGGASTRSASEKPEEGEAVTMTYHDAATTRAQDGTVDMTAEESKIHNAYIVQFNGTSSLSTVAWVSGDIKNQLSSGAAITCNFAMTAGVKNRVYVVANLPTGMVPTKDMLMMDFEATVALSPTTSVPATGLPMSAVQDVSLGDVFDVFQLKSVLAKLTFTCPTAGASLLLKGLPNGYSFYTPEPGDVAVREYVDMNYSNTGFSLVSGTTYYVPENLSGRNELLIKHSQRALGLAPANSMYVAITNGDTVYNLLLGDGSASDFNFAGGGIYNINVVLSGTDSSDLRVGNPITSAPTDLNRTGETANCYVVRTNRWYLFNSTVMGNGATTPLPANIDAAKSVASAITPTKLNPVRADVLWETQNTATAPAKGAVVNNNLYLLKDRILFRSGTVEGNAVIAARDASNTIIWSWHIWRTNTDPTVAPQTLSSFTATGGTFDATGTATLSGLRMLDRNLGALSATAGDNFSTGLIYQWGRKDPFPGGAVLSSASTSMASTISTSVAAWPFVAAGGASIALGDAVKNPTTFYTGSDWTSRNDNLWGTALTFSVVISNGANNTFNSNRGSKSIYDPCPLGWRVPPGYAFANASKGNGGTFSKGYSFGILTSGSGWCPASGSRDGNDGTLNYVGADGFYRTSAPDVFNPAVGSYLYFNSSSVISANFFYRSDGYSVRCAQE